MNFQKYSLFLDYINIYYHGYPCMEPQKLRFINLNFYEIYFILDLAS